MSLKTFAVLAGIVLTIVSTFAGDTPAEAKAPRRCGGYSEAKIDSDVKAAASFAVHAEAKLTGRKLRLVGVSGAEKQVVAGLNYRLLLNVREGDKVLNAQAVVWSKLDGTRVLMSWDWMNVK